MAAPSGKPGAASTPPGPLAAPPSKQAAALIPPGSMADPPAKSGVVPIPPTPPDLQAAYLAPGAYSTVKSAPVAPTRAGSMTDAWPQLPSDAGVDEDATLPGVAVSTHLSAAGEVHMVDVTKKAKTHRRAVASAVVLMRAETAQRLAAHEAPKGEVLATA